MVSTEPLQLPRDVELIAAECHALRPELLVFDPFFAVLGVDEKNRFIKTNDDQSIRRVLARLKTLAEQEGVAVVLLRHLNKASGGSALKRGSGSIAISALARSVMLVGKDGAGPDSRVLAMVKTNLDAMPPSVSFRVLKNSNSSTIQWDGVSDLSADDLVAAAAGKDLHPAVLSAAYFLKMTLLEHFKLTWAQLTALATEESIPEITLRRAREAVPLLKACQGRNVFWTLPQPLMGAAPTAERVSMMLEASEIFAPKSNGFANNCGARGARSALDGAPARNGNVSAHVSRISNQFVPLHLAGGEGKDRARLSGG